MKDFSVEQLAILFVANAAAGFGLWTAIGLFFTRKRSPGNFLLGAFWLAFAYWLIITGLRTSGLIQAFPAFIWTHTPMAYCMGPLLYLHFYRLSHPGPPLPRRMLIHFIPALFTAIALLPGMAQSLAYRLEMDKKIYHIRAMDYVELAGRFPHISAGMAYTELLKIISVGTKASLLIYLVILLRKSFFFPEKHESEKKDQRVFNLIMVLFCVALMISISNHFLDGQFYVFALTILIALGVFILLALEQNSSTLKYLVARKEQVYRAPQALPSQDEMQELIDRFDRLMGEKEIYKNDELKIKDVAESLGVKPYRLSRALNEKLGKTFNQIINEFRIEKAREMLRDNPDWTVLRISIEVGFNSKSAFHRAFKQIAGINPEEFRKQSQG